MNSYSLGIIGCGNIGIEILKHKFRNIRSFYIFDINKKKLHKIKNQFFNLNISICSSIEEVISSSDIIIESANISAVKSILKSIKPFPEKKLLIMSVGGILQNYKLYKNLISKHYKIYIPSGAIAGCDALISARLGKIKRILLRTTKPTNTLSDTQYVKTHKQLYNKLITRDRVIVFKGKVNEAIRYFPQNINVSATLAVISGLPEKVKVEIIADKNIKKNIHEIEIDSSAGKIYTKTENAPSKSNPKTSYLAVLSAISCLEKLVET